MTALRSTSEKRTDGDRQDRVRKFFPGYVLVNMEMNDDTWHLVKSVPKVMGFIRDART